MFSDNDIKILQSNYLIKYELKDVNDYVKKDNIDWEKTITNIKTLYNDIMIKRQNEHERRKQEIIRDTIIEINKLKNQSDNEINCLKKNELKQKIQNKENYLREVIKSNLNENITLAEEHLNLSFFMNAKPYI